MEADVLISEGGLARVYIVFQTREGQKRTVELILNAEGF
jgi:hypothetical protein